MADCPLTDEAGYEVRSGLAEFEVPAAMYSERAYFQSRAFITHALNHPVRGLEREISKIYLTQDKDSPRLLERAICDAIEVIRRSEKSADGEGQEAKTAGRRVSLGALSPLRQRAEDLLVVLQGKGYDSRVGVEWLKQKLHAKDTGALREGELFEKYHRGRKAEV